MSRLLGAVVALALALVGAHYALRGNDEPPEVDMAKVERVIARQAERQVGYPVRVECPSEGALEPGRVYHCVVRGNGQRAMATVTLENGAGDFTWRTDQ